jgi:hypothetical protein
MLILRLYSTVHVDLTLWYYDENGDDDASAASSRPQHLMKVLLRGTRTDSSDPSAGNKHTVEMDAGRLLSPEFVLFAVDSDNFSYLRFLRLSSSSCRVAVKACNRSSVSIKWVYASTLLLP